MHCNAQYNITVVVLRQHKSWSKRAPHLIRALPLFTNFRNYNAYVFTKLHQKYCQFNHQFSHKYWLSIHYKFHRDILIIYSINFTGIYFLSLNISYIYPLNMMQFQSHTGDISQVFSLYILYPVIIISTMLQFQANLHRYNISFIYPLNMMQFQSHRYFHYISYICPLNMMYFTGIFAIFANISFICPLNMLQSHTMMVYTRCTMIFFLSIEHLEHSAIVLHLCIHLSMYSFIYVFIHVSIYRYKFSATLH